MEAATRDKRLQVCGNKWNPISASGMEQTRSAAVRFIDLASNWVGVRIRSRAKVKQVVYDEEGQVWAMLHSGSRNVGNTTATVAFHSNSCFRTWPKSMRVTWHGPSSA